MRDYSGIKKHCLSNLFLFYIIANVKGVNRMQPSKALVLSDLIEKNRRIFKIPVYQRNYDWSSTQCEKLYNDIISAYKRDHKHFMGTIVYISGLTSSSLDEVLIIDGQQRLTTMYILLKALYDIAKSTSIRTAEEIEEVMFNRHCDGKYKIKLKPIKTDNEQLMLLIENEIDAMNRNSNVYKNYVLFRNLIEKTILSGIEVNDILFGIKKLEMVEIVLDKSQGDEPQKIFESINSTGLELSLADLIRNYLLMDDEKQDELYQYYWIEIEKNVGYHHLEDFFVNFLNSRISKSVNSKNAYNRFKEYCEKYELSHEDILKTLKRTSKYYGTFIGEKSFYSPEIVTYVAPLQKIKQTTIFPLLFRIFDDYEDHHIDEKTLCNVLEYFLTYLVRMSICETGKNLNKFMKSMYDRVINGKYDNYYNKFVIFLNDLRTNARMPNDDEFKEALIYKPLFKKPVCKYVLSVIENSTKEHIDINTLTVEHILPQKENSILWKKEVGEDYNRIFDMYLHTLGNLTITGYKSELGTRSFSEKKKIIQENSKVNILNKDILSADTWNEKSILNRAEVLSEILMKKFPYIDIHHDNTESLDEGIAANSDMDFANTVPADFVFLGEYIKVKSWADLLTKFINISYELDTSLWRELAEMDYSISNSNRVYISNDVRKLRKARQIENTGIYFEINLSATNIMSFVKELLRNMNLDGDEFKVRLLDEPFDINNQRTWKQKSVPVAKLFFYLVNDLIANGKITESEIAELKTKPYTKSLFSSTDYPAIANNVTDNRGNSTHKRYRTQALKYNGKDIYVSTQFFEADRDAIIEWYKSH